MDDFRKYISNLFYLLDNHLYTKHTYITTMKDNTIKVLKFKLYNETYCIDINNISDTC